MKFDFKKFFSDKKNIIITALAVVALALVITVICLAAAGGNNGANNGAANNGPVEKTYTLAVVSDDGFGKVSNKGKVTSIALAIVFDDAGKIVDACFDSVEALELKDGELVTANRLTTKVEKGDSYGGMTAGSWENQADAFEYFIIGKTAAEVAALAFVADGNDAGLVAGCTMKSSMPAFQALVAKAAAYTRKVTFKTTETVTLGLAINAKLTGNVEDGAKISADFAAAVVAGGKVVASMLDSTDKCEYTYTYNEEKEAYDVTVEYNGTKNEQGDAYDSEELGGPMPSGRWYAQAQAFANTAVGKTVAELSDLSTDPITGSCSIYTGGYKAVIVRAAGNAR